MREFLMTPDYERKKKEKQLENNESLKEFPDFDLSPAPDREATRHSRPETAGEPYNPVARSYNAPERPPSKTTPPSGATLPSAGLLPSVERRHQRVIIEKCAQILLHQVLKSSQN